MERKNTPKTVIVKCPYCNRDKVFERLSPNFDRSRISYECSGCCRLITYAQMEKLVDEDKKASLSASYNRAMSILK